MFTETNAELVFENWLVESPKFRFLFNPKEGQNITRLSNLEDLIELLQYGRLNWKVEDRSESFNLARHYKDSGAVVRKLRELKDKKSNNKMPTLVEIKILYRDLNSDTLLQLLPV